MTFGFEAVTEKKSGEGVSTHFLGFSAPVGSPGELAEASARESIGRTGSPSDSRFSRREL